MFKEIFLCSLVAVYLNFDITTSESISNKSDIEIRNDGINTAHYSIEQSTTNSPLTTVKIIIGRTKKNRELKKSQKNNRKPSHFPNNNNSTNTTKRGRKRMKKNRRKQKRMRKIKNMSSNRLLPPLQSGNLIRPVPPLGTVEEKSTTPRSIEKIFKNTRCTKHNGGCSHICRPRGNKNCGCFRGFVLEKDQHRCRDVNECAYNNGGCQRNCTNLHGSYRCGCPPGLRLDSNLKTCEDINECILRNGHGPCQDTCENTFGSYRCSCSHLNGTQLGNDQRSCIDIDECSNVNGGCSHICINSFGRRFCSCPDGMDLEKDLKTCRDIIEFQNDEHFTTNFQCPPLALPEIGYWKCSERHISNDIGKLVHNRKGTKCILMCPKSKNRKSRLKCGNDGQWIGDLTADCKKYT